MLPPCPQSLQELNSIHSSPSTLGHELISHSLYLLSTFPAYSLFILLNCWLVCKSDVSFLALSRFPDLRIDFGEHNVIMTNGQNYGNKKCNKLEISFNNTEPGHRVA